jgi:hypothetical protein
MRMIRYQLTTAPDFRAALPLVRRNLSTFGARGNTSDFFGKWRGSGDDWIGGR